MACLQGFPYEWRFVGRIGSVGRQIGNAVPPLLAMQIGSALLQPETAERSVTREMTLFGAA